MAQSSFSNVVNAHAAHPLFIENAPEDEKLPIILLGSDLFAAPASKIT